MNKKILFIDDDEDVLEIIKIVLVEEGFEVTLSTKSLSIDKVLDLNPDVILLDNWLINELGSDFCKLLKSDERVRDIPVILISATHDLKATAKECNADSFIEKPFEVEAVIEAIQNLLEGYSELL